jgi:hypothetical protein
MAQYKIIVQKQSNDSQHLPEDNLKVKAIKTAS